MLREGADRDLIVRALIQHGANVNEASYPCFDEQRANLQQQQLLPAPLFFFSLSPTFLPLLFFVSQFGGVANVQNSGSSATFNSCGLTENSGQVS